MDGDTTLTSRLNDFEKARIVALILNGKLEAAVSAVSEAYGKSPPKVRVGVVKGHSNALATYDASKKTIFVSDSSLLTNPFVILHELYHHIRIFSSKHRGTEKHANRFALDFIKAYLRHLSV